MKAILEFNLPEEDEEFTAACNGRKYAAVINNLDNRLRAFVKYDDKLPEDALTAYEKCRDAIREICEDWDVMEVL